MYIFAIKVMFNYIFIFISTFLFLQPNCFETMDMLEENWIEDDLSDEDDSDYSEFNDEELHERCGHVAVRLDKYMVMFGGYVCQRFQFQGETLFREEYLSSRAIWTYNMDTNRWKCIVTKGCKNPPGTSGACAISIGRDIYMQGGHTHSGNTNALWKLSFTADKGLFWTEIKMGSDSTKQPSPRDKHAAWEYDGKLWTFGGFGPPCDGYLSEYGSFLPDSVVQPPRGWNNQMHCFDPDTSAWSSVDIQGCSPSPRAAHAVACLGEKMWLFGGRTGVVRLNDLFEFHLPTKTWTSVRVCSIEQPIGRSWHSLTAVPPSQLIVHGGYSSDKQPLGDTWVLHLSTLSWQQHYTDKDHARLWHTATTGIDADVIVFGGCCNDILSQFVHTEMCNDVHIVRTRPRSLFRLALEAVYDARQVLQYQWTSLPGHLNNILQEMYTVQLSSETKTEEKPHSNIACTIS